MRKRIISLCCVLMLSLTTLVFGSVDERCYNNTVAIQDIGNCGSGVLFTREDSTFIWTVAHVAKHYMKPDGTFREITIRQDNKVAKARVLRCGDCYVAHDLALLQIIEGDLKGDAQFYRAFNEVKLGRKIIHCGTPYGSRLNANLLFYGNISHIGRIFSLPFMPVPREIDQCDIITHPGCSGGPVFDAETGDILGLMVLGGNPGLTAIVPTRIIYGWTKSHDCLWAFDPEIPLPRSIVSWRCDTLDRLIKERDTSEIDKRWGKELEPEPEPEPEEEYND